MLLSLASTVTDAILDIEAVSSCIEGDFAKVGQQLGRGQAIFRELNGGLVALSGELSGTEIEAASTALQAIAGRLNGLAEALPTEIALLEAIGSSAREAGALIKPLFKHIQMITIIARSARIEAASLDGDRENFLVFTQEAYDLGKQVQRSVEGSACDQQQLSRALELALARQREFEQGYRDQLLSASAKLTSAHSELREQRAKSTHVAEHSGARTRKLAEAVGRSIVALQAGDSTRQRLEHVCHGLSSVGLEQPTLVERAGEARGLARSICQLQAAQLKDCQREFGHDIGQIVRALSSIHSDATGIVDHAHSLLGGKDGERSFLLTRIKQTLAAASKLIATCESAGKSVDDALTAVEQTLTKFRQAISDLSEKVIDVTLIGMNAGLKAAHLGSKGNAFLVIANELKSSADQVSAGAARLKPVLDRIERTANELREFRLRGDSTRLAELEPAVLQALRELEEGDTRLGRLMDRLVDEGAEFETLMNAAQALVAGVGQSSSNLPAVAARLEAGGGMLQELQLGAADQVEFDELFARYTMERERQVHREFLQRGELGSAAVAREAQAVEADDGVLLF